MNPIAIRLIVLAVMLCATFGAGYFTKSQFMLASEAKQSRVVIKDSAKGIVEGVKESGRIEVAVAKTDAAVNSIKAEVKKRGVTLTAKLPLENCHDRIDSNVGQTQEGSPYPDYRDYSGDGFMLDVGTVGLLNAAREGRPVEPAGGGNEEKSAPSTVGVTDLVQNDLEIIRMYHDLAKRHDELVDSVIKKLEDQAQ